MFPGPTMRYSDITPKEVYLNRRRFLAAALALPIPAAAGKLSARKTAFNADFEKITPQNIVTTYNNYYEFGTGKTNPRKTLPSGNPLCHGPFESKAEWRSPRLLTSI